MKKSYFFREPIDSSKLSEDEVFELWLSYIFSSIMYSYCEMSYPLSKEINEADYEECKKTKQVCIAKTEEEVESISKKYRADGYGNIKTELVDSFLGLKRILSGEKNEHAKSYLSKLINKIEKKDTKYSDFKEMKNFYLVIAIPPSDFTDFTLRDKHILNSIYPKEKGNIPIFLKWHLILLILRNVFPKNYYERFCDFSNKLSNAIDCNNESPGIAKRSKELSDTIKICRKRSNDARLKGLLDISKTFKKRSNDAQRSKEIWDATNPFKFREHRKITALNLSTIKDSFKNAENKLIEKIGSDEFNQLSFFRNSKIKNKNQLRNYIRENVKHNLFNKEYVYVKFKDVSIKIESSSDFKLKKKFLFKYDHSSQTLYKFEMSEDRVEKTEEAFWFYKKMAQYQINLKYIAILSYSFKYCLPDKSTPRSLEGFSFK